MKLPFCCFTFYKKSTLTKLAYFSKAFQDPRLSGAIVTSTLEVCVHNAVITSCRELKLRLGVVSTDIMSIPHFMSTYYISFRKENKLKNTKR
jgi:hypothetical protein